jgi:hypothetical protein
MQMNLAVLPALFFAGLAVAQDGRPDPRDPKAKSPPVEYRSAFEGYRRYAEPELRDWREVNEEVRNAAGHAGHKPQPGKPK